MIMKQLKLTYTFSVLSYSELTDEAKKTVDAAKEASYRAYAPYSNFLVGAAVLLDDGTIVTGSNQENAAFPSGICAERTAVFSANSLYPEQPVKILAIAAQRQGKFVQKPVTPCGSCRQVLLESEKRFGKEIEFYFYGTDEIYYLKGTEALLPLNFSLT
jgi:cytidine deaminase